MAENANTENTGSLFSGTRLKLLIGVFGLVFVVVIVLFVLRSRNEADEYKQTTPKSMAGISIDGKNESVKRPKRRGKIKYELLYTQLDNAQIAAVLRELSLNGIAFNTERKGRFFDLEVDRKYIEEAKNLLAIKGLPTGGTKGFEIFDEDQGLGATEFDKRIRFIRALSGELEQSIVQFQDIESCTVQVVLPKQRLFSSTQPPVTASVLFRKVPGRTVSDETVFGIIQLVANAVEDLQIENVSVIDVEGRVVSIGVFDRLRKKQKPKPVIKPIKPIVQQENVLEEWLKLKQSLEAELTKKTIDQLVGILDVDSYKLAVTADLVRSNSGSPMIRQLAISIVVDSIQVPELKPLHKKQIFQTVATSVGYVRNRDVIKLSLAPLNLLEKKKAPPLLPDFQPPIEEHHPFVTFFLANYLFFGFGFTFVSCLLAGWLFWDQRRSKQSLYIDPEISYQSQSALSDRLVTIVDENPAQFAQVIEQWVNESQGSRV